MSESETITVNIKAIRAASWANAKLRADAADESMGEWVSRAIDQLAAAEAAGPRLIPPVKPISLPANPPAKTTVTRRPQPTRLERLEKLASIARDLGDGEVTGRVAKLAKAAIDREERRAAEADGRIRRWRANARIAPEYGHYPVTER
jgi:hypothetical protein